MLRPAPRNSRLLLLAVGAGPLRAEPFGSSGPACAEEVPPDWRELLKLDDDMRRFFATRVPRTRAMRRPG